MAKKFYPVTPAGTICDWLESDTEQEAIKKLLEDAAHMPYEGWDIPGKYGFKARGYTIEEMEQICRFLFEQISSAKNEGKDVR